MLVVREPDQVTHAHAPTQECGCRYRIYVLNQRLSSGTLNFRCSHKWHQWQRKKKVRTAERRIQGLFKLFYKLFSGFSQREKREKSKGTRYILWWPVWDWNPKTETLLNSWPGNLNTWLDSRCRDWKIQFSVSGSQIKSWSSKSNALFESWSGGMSMNLLIHTGHLELEQVDLGQLDF